MYMRCIIIFMQCYISFNYNKKLPLNFVLWSCITGNNVLNFLYVVERKQCFFKIQLRKCFIQ